MTTNLSEEALLNNSLLDKIVTTPAQIKQLSLKDSLKMTASDWITFFKANNIATYPDETNRFNQLELSTISSDDLFKDASINKTRLIELCDGIYYNSPYIPHVTIKDKRITRAEVYMPQDLRPSVIWHFEYYDSIVRSYRECSTGSKFNWEDPPEEIKKKWNTIMN